jgi:hypothetical protein
MAADEETSERLAQRLVAKITDEQRRGAIGSEAYRAAMSVAYRAAANVEDLLRLAKLLKE